jgi:WD40 repeat protein
VSISPDGKLVAAGGGFYAPRAEGWLKAWDAASGKSVWSSQPVIGTTVMSLVFHSKGQSLAVGYGLYSSLKHAGYVRVHRARDGAPIGDSFGKMVGGVNAVAFDREGRRLALAGLERIEVWDVESRGMAKAMPGHTRWVYCLAFHPDGKQLASGGWDNTIKLWNLATGDAIRTIQGHRGFVEEIAFSPDGTQLASVSEAKGVWLWEVATGRELAAFHGHAHYVHGLAFHPDGRRIFSGSLDGTVKAWDIVTSRPIVFRGHYGNVGSVEFSNDGRHIVSKSGDTWTSLATKVWNLETGDEDRASPLLGANRSRDLADGGARRRSTSRISPDGKLLAEVQGQNVEVRRTANGKVAFTLKGHTWTIGDVVFSLDSARLVTASDDRTIKLWDTATGLEVLTLRGHTASAMCVAFSPDGRKLASGGIDNCVFVWDATPLPEAVFTEAKAHRLVQSQLVELPRKNELIAQLRADPGLDEPTRAAALRIAEQLVGRPQAERLAEASWRIVGSPDRAPGDYQRALRWAEEGLRLSPTADAWTLTVLGAAYYRIGRFHDALDTFDRADRASVGLDLDPEMAGLRLGFRVMMLHRMGRRDEARSQLDQLRRQLRELPWGLSKSPALLREAEALIDPKPAGTTTEERPANQDETR